MRLINADGLKKKLQARRNNSEEDFDRGFDSGIGVAMNLIHNAPTIEAKTTYDVNSAYDRGYITAMKAYSRPQGKWINQFIGGNECVMCSECKLHFDIGTNYCPNCGADMRSVDKGLQERAISDLYTAIEDTYKKLGGAE